jgi:lipoyl(octanoyl) transferase
MENNLLHIHTLKQAGYQEVWDFQEVLMQKLIQTKRNRSDESSLFTTHHLIFCEHTPVYTLGKSGSTDNLLIPEEDIETSKFEFHKINRGGDITYHGPGQWTIYPILDLECYYRDVHKYVRTLEEMVINLLRDYGIGGAPVEDFTGVWVGDHHNRKICAIGVHLSRWVSMHGLALNVNANLDHFNYIIPCGIPQGDKTVTSMSQELNRTIEMSEVKDRFISEFISHFPAEVIENSSYLPKS